MPNLMSKSPEEEQERELDEPQTESIHEDGEDLAIEISLEMEIEVSIRSLQSCGHIKYCIQVLGIILPETCIHQKKYVREHHECIVGEESAKNSQSYVETEGYERECDRGHGPNSRLGSVQSQSVQRKIDLCSLTRKVVSWSFNGGRRAGLCELDIVPSDCEVVRLSSYPSTLKTGV